MLRKIEALPQNLEREVEAILFKNIQQLRANAITAAPFDLGALRRGIIAVDNQGLSWSVQAIEKYSPYIEFGTGGLVAVPVGLESYALQFIGKGIKKIDLRPRPYLFPAFERQKPIYLKDLETMLESELKKI